MKDQIVREPSSNVPEADGPAADEGFAGAWWDWQIRKATFEDRLGDVLEPFDYDRIGGDDYDNSLEIMGCDNDLRLTEAAQRFIIRSGFSKCYVNHNDGWETHYSWRNEDAAPVRGWRRRRTDKGFEISYWPERWDSPQTANWLASGYMTVVGDPLGTAAAGKSLTEAGEGRLANQNDEAPDHA